MAISLFGVADTSSSNQSSSARLPERQNWSWKALIVPTFLKEKSNIFTKTKGADLMVWVAKRSMVDELEAMLDVVDPQPPGRSLSMRRRTFDMPNDLIQKELAAVVTEVVKMLDQENDTFDPSSLSP
ncbi:BAG family molecular chaperone regulator 7 [Camellia lanceoleosa]|nr:BAG family molecular chaperone regulator 7 [Camellia lanceoleosa]